MTKDKIAMMNRLATGLRRHEWKDYYDRFEYFSSTSVRAGCQPRIMCHPEPARRAVVLVHGLSDSTYFMSAIGDVFFERLGYDVYLPLLHGHGLVDPRGVHSDLDEWKKNVLFAVECAAARSERVSIGGLSMGGALSFYMAATHPRIDDTLYLFSAALDLALGPFGFFGELAERILRWRLSRRLDRDLASIGDHPFRYARVAMGGARQLAKLIGETDSLMRRFRGGEPFSTRVFAAHSERDKVAHIAGVERLQRVSSDFHFFRIPRSADVPHASVVLADPIPEEGIPLERANPLFAEMMSRIADLG